MHQFMLEAKKQRDRDRPLEEGEEPNGESSSSKPLRLDLYSEALEEPVEEEPVQKHYEHEPEVADVYDPALSPILWREDDIAGLDFRVIDENEDREKLVRVSR